MIHSSIFAQSVAQTEHIKHKAKIYVHNQKFLEAEKILNEEHYCIIAGIPGIGKTTLAEMLMIYYLSQDYEIISVTNDIEEAFSAIRPDVKQFFYYDDFLGQTSFADKLQKNQDRRLLNFIEITQKSKHARLVLTTREYILNQAKATYEKLATSNFDIKKCTLDLSSYTFSDKAKILFNHLYFSKLPNDHIEKITSDSNFLKIIEHPNYSPRIIEWMTDILRVQKIETEKYIDVFLENLNNPEKIWAHAFENQLSRPSQYILLCLTTLSRYTSLVHLNEAFSKLYKFDSQKYGFSTDPSDFKRGLKELDGSFLNIANARTATFQNASIQDYLKTYLRSNPFRISSILNSIIYWEQLLLIEELIIGDKNLQADFKLAIENFVTTFTYQDQIHILPTPEDILSKILKWQLEDVGDFDEAINKLLLKIKERIQQKNVSEYLLVEFLKTFQEEKELNKYIDDGLILSTKDYLVNSIDGLGGGDFDNLVEFHKTFKRFFSRQETKYIKDYFEEISYQYIESLVSDDFPHSVGNLLEDFYTIQGLAGYFRIAPSNLDELDDLITELENEPEDEDEDDNDVSWSETEEINKANIANLFDLLKDKGEIDGI
jgi:conflict system STAND superfamily ATPase